MLDAYQSDLDQADDGCLGFDCSIEELEPTKLWLRDDGGFGEIEHVIGFVLRCAEAFDLQGMWGFGWALTCSKPRLDGFGGGAHIIDLGARRTLVWIDCRSEEHTSELQSLMRISYAVFCLKKKKQNTMTET